MQENTLGQPADFLPTAPQDPNPRPLFPPATAEGSQAYRKPRWGLLPSLYLESKGPAGFTRPDLQGFSCLGDPTP